MTSKELFKISPKEWADFLYPSFVLEINDIIRNKINFHPDLVVKHDAFGEAIIQLNKFVDPSTGKSRFGIDEFDTVKVPYNLSDYEPVDYSYISPLDQASLKLMILEMHSILFPRVRAYIESKLANSVSPTSFPPLVKPRSTNSTRPDKTHVNLLIYSLIDSKVRNFPKDDAAWNQLINEFQGNPKSSKRTIKEFINHKVHLNSRLGKAKSKHIISFNKAIVNLQDVNNSDKAIAHLKADLLKFQDNCNSSLD